MMVLMIGLLIPLLGSMLGRYLCFYEKEDVGVVLMMFLDVVMGE